MQWYYANDGQRQGPVSQEQFEQLARNGVIKADTLVWCQGMANWQPYATAVPGSTAGAAPSVEGTEVCAVSGKRYPKREMIQYEGRWISAEHRDEFFQRLREGVTLPKEFAYGGFWLRFCAKFIDGILLGITGGIINVIIGMLGFNRMSVAPGAPPVEALQRMMAMQALYLPINIAIGLTYSWFFISRFDATPGKMALGLKVLRPDGSRLSAGRIIGRYFASEYISGLCTLCIGYIMAGFDKEKRALHDRMCDTRVIKAK
jgi:uncharacterized RDD family membrane protein YckC